MTRLHNIGEAVRHLLAAMKPLVHFDLSVVDDSRMRIAGTGRYEQYVGLKLPEESAFYHVIRNNSPLIIFNPLEHQVCQTCTVRNICLKEVSIIYPIQIDNEAIGAISIAEFSEEAKDKLIHMETELLAFMKNLSDFIAAKVKEAEKQKRMDAILNTVKEGIVLTDAAGTILMSNQHMEQAGARAGKPLSTLLPAYVAEKLLKADKPIEDWPYEHEDGGFWETYWITVKNVQPDNSHSDLLFLFREQEARDRNTRDSDRTDIHTVHLEQIKGKSAVFEEAKRIAASASRASSNVLIQGESGTGKELFARAIHQMSDRSSGPFIAVNCAAIPENLLESELFGFEEGAFTGARKGGKPGKFEMAQNGTLFLDEIGDLSLHLQPKLLRVIEYNKVERVGSVKPIDLNVRLIAATNQNLERMIAEGRFREDLYYRLNVIQLPLPPLRKRREDVMPLSRFFLQKFNRIFGKKIETFTEQAEQMLLLYQWPGNVRELENAIEYAVHVEQTDSIEAASLPAKLRAAASPQTGQGADCNLKQLERATIQRLLHQYGDHLEGKAMVAKQMGISLSTLYRRLREMK
ncbi:sigma 54-interacting transcriptional regulator [Brevibacillus ruminantium]|uniref:Sigma 54-interacting transcriptional regulator n=1 Tax=Brevibacillus ruminantium TaxID=2950604 RepID=A0ABY4WFP9_9BACL|nr:sigma 54-interacting transcriptional regulator [Brevibacillus ruminantium]USG65656.1 sigma 54-interacting transcriptional regulator [Brevibacillus ruminantium]